jgi:transcriptional regulator with XRE-family HTH domain
MSERKNDLKAVFGKVLREYRERAGFSQEQLGLECELDRTYISLLERGLRQPTMESLFAISEALGTKPSKLISIVEKSL